MSDKEKFRTKDLSLASGLAVLGGTDPRLESDRNGRTIFVFDDEGQSVGKMIAMYHEGASGSLVDFATKYRELKALMFSQRAAGQ